MSNTISTAVPSPVVLKTNPEGSHNSSGFGQMRPRRKLVGAKSKVAMSPEARRAIEAQNQALIDEALACGRISFFPPRWADGAVDVQGIAAKD